MSEMVISSLNGACICPEPQWIFFLGAIAGLALGIAIGVFVTRYFTDETATEPAEPDGK